MDSTTASTIIQKNWRKIRTFIYMERYGCVGAIPMILDITMLPPSHRPIKYGGTLPNNYRRNDLC